MAGTRAAARYAKAVLSLASDRSLAEVVNNDMTLIASTIDNNQNLKDAILSPVVNASVKKDVLNQVFKEVNGLTMDLFGLLLTNNRIPILSHIAVAYNTQYNTLIGREHVVVTTATALTPELEAKVLAKVKALTPSKVIIENIIDESIIGGFVLRVGDVEYNASVANQLNKLKRELTLN